MADALDPDLLEELLGQAPPELTAEVDALEDMHVLRARHDPAAFASYILRDEETNLPIMLQPMHEEWHQLASFHPRVLIWAPPESGKTHQMSIARALFELGRNRNIRICIVSNTDYQAQKICLTIAKFIEDSVEFRRVFPGVRRAPGMPWTMHQLYVERDITSPNPTVRTCGVHGNILGARIDLLIIDDILDYENTLSPKGRNDLWDWFHATLETRLTKASRVICIGTAWHVDDIMHRFAKREDWLAVRYPVVDEDGVLIWPEQWSAHRTADKRRRLGPIEFARTMLCTARSDEDSVWRWDWIKRCLDRGDGTTLTYALEVVPTGYSTHTGVDLGVRQHADSDLTAIFTFILHPDESREVVDIQAGRWQGPEIVNHIIDVHHRYQSIVTVESVAAQKFIVDFTKERSAVPVEAFDTTGARVRHPEWGLQSMSVEMANGKWIIPNMDGKVHPQVRAWLDDMLYFDPNGHPGDRLIASWLAREGCRKHRPKARVAHLDLLSR